MPPVPFFRASIDDADVAPVGDALRSGWLTTGPVARDFEQAFARFVGARHAVAVNSCTAALHLALEALGVRRGDSVLVPTMTFAAGAEVIRYFDATPVFVDCDPTTLCPDPASIAAACAALAAGRPWPGATGAPPPRVLVNLHYGGQVGDAAGVAAAARRFGLRVVDDAAHAVPADFRAGEGEPWRRVGGSAAGAEVTCFSFYANKCITTGEGGMATTEDDALAARMRLMALHGMDRDAWKRYTSAGSWAYDIVAPGYKYNLTDVAAALGLAQLRRADELLARRRAVAARYDAGLRELSCLELPAESSDRRHAWHLYAVKLRLDRLRVDRDRFSALMKERGVGHSVHWRPLHMMSYYAKTYGLAPGAFPVAAGLYPRLLSLPIFPAMTDDEIDRAIDAVRAICREHAA